MAQEEKVNLPGSFFVPSAISGTAHPLCGKRGSDEIFT
jgi:hypothetical protein